MNALPRPDLPPGPHRDLVTALHDLHHRSGWPSLRILARQAGCSHTAVSHAFSSPRLPTWGMVEVLVQALSGSTTEFRELWLAATSPRPSVTPPTRIAGRGGEQAVVRRHLETGDGILLVTGEAGMGKTTLVAAAGAASDVFVAVGHCLPLSTEVPLLPVVDALRMTYSSDDGQWMKEALADCPSYVRTSLARLLPEVGAADGAPDTADPWGSERLFTSVVLAARALAATRPFALLVEDCHWADSGTLDLLSRLTTRSAGFPVVATWRAGDPHVPESHSQWLAKARWSTGVAAVDLAPLTRGETAQQLRLLAGSDVDDDVVERVHARGQGLPLYTALLAEAQESSDLPHHLAELVDRRLGDLGGAAWQVARLLGVAQRPLGQGALLRASGLEVAELDDAMQTLAQRRLLHLAAGDRAGLAHPLLAEAVARRLLPGEAALVHSRLAESLAAEPQVEPGVVAGHWRAAGRPDLEAAPLVAAARQAGERFSHRDELDAWGRVVELWDAGHVPNGIELWDVLTRAVNASVILADHDTGRPMLARALDLDLPGRARARVLERAGAFLFHQGAFEIGLGHLDEAVALLEQLPPSAELVQVLDSRIGFLVQIGRFGEARADVRRALNASGACDDLGQRRRVLNWSAWLTMCAGDHEEALAEARRAQAIRLPEPDPLADVFMAVNTTDILLHAAAPAAQVEEAASEALHEIEVWNLEHTAFCVLLRDNVARAHLRAGDVRAARRFIEPVTRSDPTTISAPAHSTLAAIELREGHVDAALDRCQVAGAAQASRHDQNWTEGVPLDADVTLWAARSDAALSMLQEALAVGMAGEASRWAAPLLTVSARAHADQLADADAAEGARHEVSARLRQAVAEAAVDPFGERAPDAAIPALAASWRAELARIDGTATVEAWSRAAAEWDRLVRPHDSAYCRWRAAQVALRDGQGTIATRLLERARTDARQHAPLTDAIAATGRGADAWVP